MNRGEKRHFRLSVKKYDRGTNYLRLFDVIDQQEEYDEAAIKKLFKEESFVQRLTATKNYLYELLLQSLCEHGGDSTPEQQVIELYRRIVVLVDRRLYEQAETFIRRAKEMCYHYDLFHELMLVLSLEAYIPWLDRSANFREWRRAQEVLNNILLCGDFAETLRVMLEERRVLRTARDYEEAEAIVAAFPLASLEEALTFSAKLRYHFGYTQYYILTQQKEQYLMHNEALIDLFHCSPQYITTNTLAYLSQIRSLYSQQIANADYTSALATIDTFRSIDVPGRFVPFRDMLLLLMELIYAENTAGTAHLDELEQRYIQLLARGDREIDSYGVDMDVHFLRHFTVLFFMRGEYSRALGHLEQLLRKPTLKRYPYIENDARILFLILHYELGNTALLPYSIRSTYRFLLSRERLYVFEKCVLRHLRLLVRVHGTSELQTWFQTLLDEITTLTNDPVQGGFLRRSQYLAWLESKVAGRECTTLPRQPLSTSG